MKWIEFESKFSMKLSSCWPIRSVTICLNMPGTESQDGRWTSTSSHLLAASVTYLLRRENNRALCILWGDKQGRRLRGFADCPSATEGIATYSCTVLYRVRKSSGG